MRRFAIVASVLVMTGAMLQAQGQQPQPAPTNLKVLPKTMPRQEVVQIMRAFTRGLGVRCQHCHVGEGNDLSKFDFASDAKPTKEIARKMLVMVNDINGKYLAGVEAPPPPPPAPDAPAAPAAPAVAGPKVNCFTCHRGALKPLTAAPPVEGRGGGGPKLKW
jgi:hypothetical protein